MKWYREGETYRFEQSIGRQSVHGKSLKKLTELEPKELEINDTFLIDYKEGVVFCT